ncbi:MAG: T9SS type A sorting domain-containing protein [Bacteroidetes bacterium]|nr:T9SS type A sorting domain-containing protein [Bacteroidota bacterium]
MYQIRLHSKYLFLFIFFTSQLFFTTEIAAQVGCPNCNVSLPALPADTIYISDAPDGEAGQIYDHDISFRMPKTTTPVNATDPDTPPGLNISQIDIVAVVNVPPGLNWQPSQFSFNPSNQTDGCVKFCGTPLQPGLYNVEVFVTATVLTLNQSTSFSFPIYIAPSSSNNDGFTMENNSGCGEVTVAFENNMPSNGNNGYSYFWEFGNGSTSILENPSPVTYTMAGDYVVNYTATIDTFGYEVSTVRVLDAGCNDIIINTKPDLYVKIRDPQGNFVVITDVQDNAPFPAIFNINLPLGDGTYELEVRDEDTFGSESCGYIYFTKTTTGILTSGDLDVQVDIIHPVQTVQSTGIVTVYEQPSPPLVTPSGVLNLCQGEDVELVADYDQNIQWYQDTTVLFGEVYQQLNVASAGNYWLEYTSPLGCKAQSEVVEVNLLPLPNSPVFEVVGNEFTLSNTVQLPTDYSLQWYMDGNLLVDETGPSYCLMEPGVFLMTLEITDESSGCTNEFSLGVAYDPAYTCASGANEMDSSASTLALSPNPTNGQFWADFYVKKPGKISFQLFDSVGKMISQESIQDGNTHVRHEINLGNVANGFYLLKIQTEEGWMAGRVLKQ